jgi:hypothetical protein
MWLCGFGQSRAIALIEFDNSKFCKLPDSYFSLTQAPNDELARRQLDKTQQAL